MSQMPDKIWLHKNAKYNTGDVVCGYQYEFAQEIECEGIENFVEYVPVDSFIEESCEWLSNVSIEDMTYKYDNFDTSEGWYKFIDDFKNYMKEKQTMTKSLF